MMANKPKGTIYIGVTSDIVKRATEHKYRLMDGFTKRYNVSRLVWFESHADIHTAMAMEKKLKNIPRQKKVEIIETLNPEWSDLYSGVTQAKDPALLLTQPVG